MADEEVLMEVEAVQAVYGDDCVVLNTFPPHLHVHLNPRTADVHSQQFVEATIELRAGPQYPCEPPYVGIIGSKGLDEKRQMRLSASLHDKGRELASCLMLVALCEEAVERLSSMNLPQGDCPLCLYPLVPEEEQRKSKSFMKLMSCFHCFHCECIIRWLMWIQKQNGTNCGTFSVQSSSMDESDLLALDLHNIMGDNTGACPVCRKVFLAKDIEHVLNMVDSQAPDTDVDEEELSYKLLQCDMETNRRHKFEVILELQQQHGGLIEPPKDNILFTRISVHDLAREVLMTEGEVVEQQQDREDKIIGEEPGPSGSSNESCGPMKKQQTSRGGPAGHTSSEFQRRPYAGQRRHTGPPRKHGRNNSKPLAKQWMKKD